MSGKRYTEEFKIAAVKQVAQRGSWLESGSVYGYRKVSGDLRELGEQCGINRVQTGTDSTQDLRHPGRSKAGCLRFIEMFYNPKRRPGVNEKLSPVDFEKRHFQRLASI
jgi:hypothetical protein